MKKLFLLFTLLLFTFNSYSQDSKFYLGLGAGLATIGGDVNDGDAYKMGLHINFLNTSIKKAHLPKFSLDPTIFFSLSFLK
jgi:hypothetical protein